MFHTEEKYTSGQNYEIPISPGTGAAHGEPPRERKTYDMILTTLS